IPLGLALFVGAIISYHTDLHWCFTAKCFAVFSELFKVPITIAAMAFPLVAIVASNHRSKQSAYTSELQQSQNNFANHYLHIEKFGEYIEEKNTFLKEYDLRPRVVHKVFFPNSRSGETSLNQDLLLLLKTRLKLIENLAVRYLDAEKTEDDELKTQILTEMVSCSMQLKTFTLQLMQGTESASFTHFDRLVIFIDLFANFFEDVIYFDSIDYDFCTFDSFTKLVKFHRTANMGLVATSLRSDFADKTKILDDDFLSYFSKVI
ncbi:MAG: hypothetical protein HRT35_03925, partial [Algicola sp.]|nr:hypothetical protein [Algicola sp.]